MPLEALPILAAIALLGIFVAYDLGHRRGWREAHRRWRAGVMDRAIADAGAKRATGAMIPDLHEERRRRTAKRK